MSEWKRENPWAPETGADRNGVNDIGGDTASETERDPLEALASEFADRFRRGDDVTVEDYARQHPRLADEIRELFPTIAAMERLHTKKSMESADSHRKPPQQLGDYRIIQEIARGGMGIVYEAEQISLGRKVAVKVLPPRALTRHRDIQRFQREAKTAAGLHHSNIVPVFGVGEDDGRHYIVMQLIRGVGLDEVLNEVKQVFVEGSNSPSRDDNNAHRFAAVVRSAANLIDHDLPMRSTSIGCEADTVDVDRTAEFEGERPQPLRLRESFTRDYFQNVARIGLQAAEALHYAHQHDTLHRDIKPGNLILDEEGRVWIADFGLAKAVQDNEVTRSGDVVGTIAYVAPERFQGSNTKSSDVYGLGVTLYEMLTLQKAFVGRDRVEVLHQITQETLPRPRKINPSVPADLETIIMKAAALDPRDRYASAGAMARDLEAFLEDRPIEARRLGALEKTVRWARRNRSLAATTCGMIISAIAAMVLLAVGYRVAEKERAHAEETANRAIEVVDRIYGHFTPSPIASTRLDTEVVDELSVPDVVEQVPISKKSVQLLQDLLEFYDDFAVDSANTDAVEIKAISAMRRVGDIHRRLDQMEDARKSYRQAIERIEKLPAPLRSTVAMRLETARTYNGMGLTMLREWRGSQERIQAHRAAVEVLDRDQVTADEKFELATSLYFSYLAEKHSRRSVSQDDCDSESSVSTYLEEAQSLLSELSEIASHPNHDLLLARVLLADEDRSQDGGGSRGEMQEQGLSILRRLVTEHPDNPEYQFELGLASLHCDSCATRGKPRCSEQLAESELRWRNSLAATQGLEVHHPNIPKYYQLKKELNERLARVLKAQGKSAEAVSFYQDAIRMQQQLMTHAENPETHRPWLYWLQQDYGRLLLDLEQYSEAHEVLAGTANELQEFLQGPGATRGRFVQHESRRKLQSAYRGLARIAEQQGDQATACEWTAQADAID